MARCPFNMDNGQRHPGIKVLHMGRTNNQNIPIYASPVLKLETEKTFTNKQVQRETINRG